MSHDLSSGAWSVQISALTLVFSHRRLEKQDELARLRREKAELRKRVKLEDGVKREEGSSPKGRFIDLSDL